MIKILYIIFILILFVSCTPKSDEASKSENEDLHRELVKESEKVQKALENAKNMKSQVDSSAPRITINLQQDENGEAIFYVDSKKVSFKQMKEQLNRQSKDTIVMIRCDKNVLFKNEDRLINAIKESGIKKIRIQAELQ